MDFSVANLPNCSEEIPPQAWVKSPLSRFFRSGVQGEWSDTTISIWPAFSADQSCSCWDKISHLLIFKTIKCMLYKLLRLELRIHWIYSTFYLVNGPSDWGTALELCGSNRNVLCTQAEVVVGCFHRQWCSGLSCFPDQFQWLCRGQVNNMTAHPGA